MRKFRTNLNTVSNPPITTLAANFILGLAMLGAVVLGTNDFSVKSLAYELGETMELQGRLNRSE